MRNFRVLACLLALSVAGPWSNTKANAAGHPGEVEFQAVESTTFLKSALLPALGASALVLVYQRFPAVRKSVHWGVASIGFGFRAVANRLQSKSSHANQERVE